jgi:hypothetical protein
MAISLEKQKELMKKIHLKDRVRSNNNNREAFVTWLMHVHPEIVAEYTKSEFHKTLTATNLYSSFLQAMHNLKEKYP